jgi:hypothetical protein
MGSAATGFLSCFSSDLEEVCSLAATEASAPEPEATDAEAVGPNGFEWNNAPSTRGCASDKDAPSIERFSEKPFLQSKAVYLVFSFLILKFERSP